jgi:hypothetical protein
MGHFTNEDTLKQTAMAMEILKKHYLDEDHVFVFDNATTHIKCADGALSARQMSKGISKPETDFGVKISVIRDDGKPVYQMGNLLMAPSSHFIFQKITLLLQVYLKGWGLFWRNAVLWEQQDLNY